MNLVVFDIISFEVIIDPVNKLNKMLGDFGTSQDLLQGLVAYRIMCSTIQKLRNSIMVNMRLF